MSQIILTTNTVILLYIETDAGVLMWVQIPAMILISHTEIDGQ